MLFDLRGRGRRRTVQVIYLSLAILMGGGLVLFGIGGDVPAAACSTRSRAAPAAPARRCRDREARIDSALAATKARPKRPGAWAKLAALRYQLAGSDELRRPDRRRTPAGPRACGRRAAPGTATSRSSPRQARRARREVMVQAYGPTRSTTCPRRPCARRRSSSEATTKPGSKRLRPARRARLPRADRPARATSRPTRRATWPPRRTGGPARGARAG